MAVAHKTYYDLKWMHAVLAAAVLALLAVTVWMLAADARRPWKEYQREYRKLRGLPAKPPAIAQIWLPDLPLDDNFHGVARRDRCTTCHQGIDQPGAAGLPQPHAAHPRLDLFVAGQSPHPMGEFGCTVCHDGQGSATDFRWASHTPNDPEQGRQWRDRLGWSANPHWDFPMLPRRFSQSRCLECHPEVVDLELPSRFRLLGGTCGAPLPGGTDAMPLDATQVPPGRRDLLAGYDLVRQYGCFGCHEVPPLKDATRKVGPGLRHVAGKFDADYLAGRLRNPAEFLPDTRMPRLFGLDEHLSGRVLAETRKSEETEIQAVVNYLLASAEPVEPPTVLPGARSTPSPERGKRLFETRGCLACHRHQDFPRGGEKGDSPHLPERPGGCFAQMGTVPFFPAVATQGPDLSHVGAKYRPGSGTAWLVGWLRDPPRYSPQTLMPTLLLDAGPTDAADLAAYLTADRGLGTSVPSAGKQGSGIRVQGPLDVDFARRTIARRGCAGCHDIPGLEDAQPIGPSLRGWGRRPASLLAFEHVDEFVLQTENSRRLTAAGEPADGFFLDALLAHRREGFLWQKLRAPRSFDYALAETKPVDEQLRMGRFELSDSQRQSIATFILALTDETPAAKYVYRPDRRRQAIIDGRKVLDKFACAGCHTLELERWTIDPGTATAGPRAGHFSAQCAQSGRVELSGAPRLDTSGALQQEEDDEGNPTYFFTLWNPAVIDGRCWPVGGADVVVPKSRLRLVRPPRGGDLARLLYPAVLADARRSGASAAEVEAWGWLPPALVHEGAKVQPEWLFRFLLDPRAIRPAAVLRMPRFGLSAAEAGKLTDYFAAASDAEFPYTASPAAASPPSDAARLNAAMRLVSDRTTYCGKCHSIGDRQPPGENRLLHAPALDQAGRRLRPEYLRRWLANPKSVLPYTAMPALFPATGKPLGQDLLPGSSQEQLDAVVSLLLQYEEYSRRRTPTPAP